MLVGWSCYFAYAFVCAIILVTVFFMLLLYARLINSFFAGLGCSYCNSSVEAIWFYLNFSFYFDLCWLIPIFLTYSFSFLLSVLLSFCFILLLAMFFALSADLSTLLLFLILLILLILFRTSLSVWCYNVFCGVSYLFERVVSCCCASVYIVVDVLLSCFVPIRVVDEVDIAERF
jgi:hypothetical protein